MAKIFLTALAVLVSFVPFAQSTPGTNKVYQATAEKVNDLVHTKLDAKFDYSKSQLNGKVWITLKPHFYPTDSLTLDAKGMDIHEVAVVKNGKNSRLIYVYDGMLLHIRLDRTYRNAEQYTVYISYTAKPDEYTGKGSAAITDAKGLYFINPRGEEKDKPTQIWTQGETEATSVWVPIIDKPNQKTTDEIYMNVLRCFFNPLFCMTEVFFGRFSGKKTLCKATPGQHTHLVLLKKRKAFFFRSTVEQAVLHHYAGKV